MPAALCPHCGAQTRVSIAQPDWMACRSCGYRGVPPHEVRAGLHQAAQVLSRTAAEDRQLSWAQRRLGAGAASASSRLGGLLALLVLPFGACGGTCFAITLEDEGTNAADLVGFFSPAAIVLIGGLLLVQDFDRRRKAAEQAATAMPPSAPGEPAGCHVCGADLPLVDPTRDATARCRFCAADNIVRPEALARAAAHRSAHAHGMFADVQEHAAALKRHQGSATLGLVMFAVLAPFAAFVGVVLVAIFDEDVPPTARYALVHDPRAGACVAEVKGKNEDGTSLLVSIDSPAEVSSSGRFDVDRDDTFNARELVGRRVRFEHGDEILEGQAKRAVRGKGMGMEWLHVDHGESQRKLVVAAVCLAEPWDEYPVFGAPSASASASAAAPPAPSASASAKPD